MMTQADGLHFETLAIHAGQEPDPATGAVIVPIYQTSTFAQEGVDRHKGYEYARTDNPTRTALQTALAALEGARWGLCYASGLAATQNVWYLLDPGDHVILSDDVYGGTYRLMARVVARYGIEYSLVDLTDPERVRAALRPETRMIWVETPTNPYLKIVDIAAMAEIAHGNMATARSWWSTTRSPRRTCSNRWRSAPTWCCTARPSTSAGTAMSWVAPCWGTIRRSTSGSNSCRTPAATCRGRSTAG